MGEGQGPRRHHRAGRRQRLVPRGTRRDDDQVSLQVWAGASPEAPALPTEHGESTQSDSRGRNLEVHDELLDGQYRDHPNLRPIANTLLAWAAAHPGVAIQMRKGYVSLHSSRRKFAQITRASNTAVDVTLRLEAPIGERLKAVKVRDGDFFDRKVRLTSDEQVDQEFLDFLETALEQNSR
ncbi:DUF5655 domain-containing protein [Arthrobacter sp. NPDC058097]|uniref:DUF5655 domain-containing protein n=1 Tax=Arthrobacter sp. NPDC058097 TaxID=3346340 RepID=UPI0036DDECB8